MIEDGALLKPTRRVGPIKAAVPAKGAQTTNHPAGRECAAPECITRLSKYNPGGVCYVHAPPTFRRMRS